MIPETPSIPLKLEPEDRFIFSLRNELRKHAQEINKMGIGDRDNAYVRYKQFNELEKNVEDLARRITQEEDWTKNFTINEQGKLCQIMEV